MARDEHHVVHNPNGGWDVKRNNAQKASVHTETKAEAIKVGRQISRNQGTEFIIHGMNGRIQNPDASYRIPPSFLLLSASVNFSKQHEYDNRRM